MRTRIAVYVFDAACLTAVLTVLTGLAAIAGYAVAERIDGAGAIAFVCVALAIALVRAVRLPGRLRLGEGVELPPDGLLARLASGAAARAGVPEADELRLMLEPGAALDDRGGRRVLHLGLPLVASLDAEALGAVVAHELSPQPHRALLERRLTLLLAAAEEERPFLRWYARRLARITERAADEARLSADAAAVRSAGGAARARGLRGWEETPGIWDEFWHRRVQPELEAGRRPPLAAGMREHVRRALRDPSAGGEDALVAEIEPLEAELLARVPGAERAETLEPETWVTPFADLPAPDPDARPG